MYLTDNDLEAVREAALPIEYGSVIININAASDKLELEAKKRIRIDKDSGIATMGMDVQKNGVVCLVERGSKKAPNKT
jgi:hypothetical protein